jgi:glycosyltransferase involved in cell wall biosynthesis
MELVSIITPSYNRENFIEETIVSVINQTYSCWELIIIDDNSTDKTLDIVRQYQDKDDRIILHIKNPDIKKGPTSSRNIGLDLSKGKYIIYLDSDDLLNRNCLQQRVSVFENHTDCSFLVFPQKTSSNNKLFDNKIINKTTQEPFLNRFLKLSPESLDVPWLNTAPIWKYKAIIDNQLFWNENLFWDDVVYHFNAISIGLKFKCFDHLEPDCIYRMHNKSREGNNVHKINKTKNFELLFKHFYKKLQKSNCYNKEIEKLLFNSYFNVLILPLIDAKRFLLAQETSRKVKLILNLGHLDLIILKTYILLRMFVSRSPRLTYYINFVFRKIARQSFFKRYASHYMRETFSLTKLS